MKTFQSKGIAAGISAGNRHISQINEDRARVKFVKAILRDEDIFIMELKEEEQTFLQRIEDEHDKTVPDIHSGDRNIIDSLRRRFEGRLL
ncbi:MAG TPA: hypothetical protein VK742_20305 [Candidatus Sulfotelmatobacter sp.]|jgi:hypothetical protein|nr:hypothetical protein [Candidatus Sulfotelmatobacter sp.]